MRTGIAALTAALLAAPAAAQEFMGAYYASISAADMRNSRGEPLSDWCAMIRQDRANHHRFGVRDDGDESDPFFAAPENRARLEGSRRVAAGSEYIVDRLEAGPPRFIAVQVFGRGGAPDFVVVSEGAG